MSAPRIYLATDYGLDDEFVGVLHAVLARSAPDVGVVDLAHGIPPFDVAAGAALLERAAAYLGPGVVLAVVDPGVGTSRRGVAVEVGGAGPRHLVGPDNGLLAGLARRLGGPRRAVALRRPTGRARTFDGRDVFAPAAAHLAVGGSLEALGEPVEPASLVVLETVAHSTRELEDGRVALLTTVRWIDRFGNVQLALDASVLDGVETAGVVVHDEDALVRVAATFGELDTGALGLVGDASDGVALVVREGSAARRLGVAVGDRVELVGAFGPLA